MFRRVDLTLLAVVVATLLSAALVITRNLNAQQFQGGMVFTGSINAVFNSNTVLGITPVSGVGVATIVAATEGDAAQVAGRAMVCGNLKCLTTDAGGTVTAAGGTSWTPALNVNLAASTLTCVEATAATGCTDTTHKVAIAAGDLLDFGWTPAGTPTALVGKCAMECKW